MHLHIVLVVPRFFSTTKIISISQTRIVFRTNERTACFLAISASFIALRSSYCARGLCSSSPIKVPSSAPVYQSRSNLTCSSSHSLMSNAKEASSPSGLPPLTTRGVGASHWRFLCLPHPSPSSLLHPRGVDSHPTFGTRTLGASRCSLRGVEPE